MLTLQKGQMPKVIIHTGRSRWHEQIGDPTLADGILDRLVHNARRIEVGGDPMRKDREKRNA